MRGGLQRPAWLHLWVLTLYSPGLEPAPPGSPRRCPHPGLEPAPSRAPVPAAPGEQREDVCFLRSLPVLCIKECGPC